MKGPRLLLWALLTSTSFRAAQGWRGPNTGLTDTDTPPTLADRPFEGHALVLPNGMLDSSPNCSVSACDYGYKIWLLYSVLLI